MSRWKDVKMRSRWEDVVKRCEKMWWQTSTIRRTLRSDALGKNAGRNIVTWCVCVCVSYSQSAFFMKIQHEMRFLWGDAWWSDPPAIGYMDIQCWCRLPGSFVYRQAGTSHWHRTLQRLQPRRHRTGQDAILYLNVRKNAFKRCTNIKYCQNMPRYSTTRQW